MCQYTGNANKGMCVCKIMLSSFICTNFVGNTQFISEMTTPLPTSTGNNHLALIQHFQLYLNPIITQTTHPPTTFFGLDRSQLKGMAKIRLFYAGAMAQILPQLKDITNFVLKLICSLFIFKCLRGDLYLSVIHHWNRQLKPY